MNNRDLQRNTSPTFATQMAYIGLGSNLNNPLQQLHQALEELSALPQTTLLKTSLLYWTKPIGSQEQPEYLNGVAALATTLCAEELLIHLLMLEQKHHRIRTHDRFGPRTLDLDLLLYGNEIINLPQLTVPHPRMKERSFVLYPLAEIAPDLVLPTGEKIQSLLQKVTWEGKVLS